MCGMSTVPPVKEDFSSAFRGPSQWLIHNWIRKPLERIRGSLRSIFKYQIQVTWYVLQWPAISLWHGTPRAVRGAANFCKNCWPLDCALLSAQQNRQKVWFWHRKLDNIGEHTLSEAAVLRVDSNLLQRTLLWRGRSWLSPPARHGSAAVHGVQVAPIGGPGLDPRSPRLRGFVKLHSHG
jgi:hypothetical protein